MVNYCDSNTGLLAGVLDEKSMIKGYPTKNYSDDEDRDERELAAYNVHAFNATIGSRPAQF
jgi:hypothetical protein